MYIEEKEFLGEEEHKDIISKICQTFQCDKNQIEILDNLDGGTNLVFSFQYSGKKYVYRHPSFFSNRLINRGREAFMQSLAGACGIDKTLINMDINEGWRIAEYIESETLNYENESNIRSAIATIRRMHNWETKVKWHFNVYDLMMSLKTEFDFKKCLKEFDLINDSIQVYKLYTLVDNDHIQHCNCHGDCRGTNFLFAQCQDPILIDWEFAGYADPGFDIGSFIAGGIFDDKSVDMIIMAYLNHKPDRIELRHYYAFIAIVSFAYFLLTEYYIYCGHGREDLRSLHQVRIKYIKYYSSKALMLY